MAKRDPCTKCGKIVFNFSRVEVNGSILHETCFNCAFCKTKLSVDNFMEHEKFYYCVKDFYTVVRNQNKRSSVVIQRKNSNGLGK